jgi:hypothetical protein
MAGGRRKNVGKANTRIVVGGYFCCRHMVTPNDVVRKEIAENIGIGY